MAACPDGTDYNRFAEACTSTGRHDLAALLAQAAAAADALITEASARWYHRYATPGTGSGLQRTRHPPRLPGRKDRLAAPARTPGIDGSMYELGILDPGRGPCRTRRPVILSRGTAELLERRGPATRRWPDGSPPGNHRADRTAPAEPGSSAKKPSWPTYSAARRPANVRALAAAAAGIHQRYPLGHLRRHADRDQPPPALLRRPGRHRADRPDGLDPRTRTECYGGPDTPCAHSTCIASTTPK